MRHAFRFGIAALAAAASTSALGAQQYPQTMYWGSGLVNVPVAWVGPLDGDFALNYSGVSVHSAPGARLSWSNSLNQQMSGDVTGFGRLELGATALSLNPEWGLFGRLLLVRDQDLPLAGFAHWIVPSVAVGMRNIGPYGHIDRFGSGYMLLPTPGSPNESHVPDSLHANFNTANTVYGVASKTYSLRDINPGAPDLDLGLTLGYGNGLFKSDGGLGAAYASHATGGLFYGANVNFTLTPHLVMTLMGENDAWEYNAGASLIYRGIRATASVMDLGAHAPAFNPYNADLFYNYSKFAFSLGWQSNIFALMRGDFLQRHESALLQQRQGLLAEIALRQQRIASLELEINRYEAQSLLDLEQRRASAQVQLREEQDALKRLEDRLKRVEQQLPPSNPKPPTPPEQH